VSDAACRSCGDPVLWVVMEKTGKRMPLNEDPRVQKGTRFTASGWNDPESGSPVYHAVDSSSIEAGCASHFSTCRDAAKHRQ
jgi:hypothetical protein